MTRHEYHTQGYALADTRIPVFRLMPTPCFTLTLQKSRMPQILGVEGEAVVLYREPSTMRRRRTSAGDAVSSAFPEDK
jgi:hypothetical protein